MPNNLYSKTITDTYIKVVFYYEKTIKPSEGESFQRVDSTSFNYCYHPADIKDFIKNKIEALKLIGCEVFQYGIYEVTEKLINSYEIKGAEQIEIL